MDKQILLEALITEREGMLAENTHRLDCGNSIAYGEEHFSQLASQMRELASQLEDSADCSECHYYQSEKYNHINYCPKCDRKLHG